MLLWEHELPNGPEVLAACAHAETSCQEASYSFMRGFIDELKLLDGQACSVARIHAKMCQNPALTTSRIAVPSDDELPNIVLAKLYGSTTVMLHAKPVFISEHYIDA